MTTRLNSVVWERLSRNESVEGLGLPVKAGRLDIGGLQVPQPYKVGEVHTKIADLDVVSGTTKICGAVWSHLDFTSSMLSAVWLKRCRVSDCLFDGSVMKDIRVWATDFSDVSFRSADMRGALLAGVEAGKRNSFIGVDFSRADLRGSIYNDAEFINCRFSHTKLDKVNFQSCTFENCIFEGHLREVLFYRAAFRKGDFPENRMTGVDFSKASLRWVEFRGLDMTSAVFPNNDEHIVIRSFPEKLDQLIELLQGREDMGSRRLCAVFRNKKKWVGSECSIGVLNESDILEAGGREGLAAVRQITEDTRVR